MNKQVFLIANDDGYFSPGLIRLAKALLLYGKVRVVAPHVEQSAMSHRITIFHGLKLHQYDSTEFEYYSVEGSPADCVRLGLGLFKDTTMVFSGINNGMNIGIDTLYSGTVGAALQANIGGVNSFAISAPWGHFDLAEKTLDEILPKLFQIAEGLDSFCFNVNFPNARFTELTGIQITRTAYFEDRLEFHLDHTGRYIPTYYNLAYPMEEGTDYYAFEHGYLSITPLTTDKTDQKLYQEILNKQQGSKKQ